MDWNLDPPPGFQGLHPDKPVGMHERHLPHWRQAGATYFVTFRLADSLPQNRLRELKALRDEWERANPLPRTDEQRDRFWKDSFLRLDSWLDAGSGSCRLRDSRAGRLVSEALSHFEGERYELGCSVVMPNHIHSIVRPFEVDDEALSRVTHAWKRYTSREINKLFGLSESLWQDESYDRIIRDEEELWHTIQYIGRNPKTANLVAERCHLWLSPAWQELGWKFTSQP